MSEQPIEHAISPSPQRTGGNSSLVVSAISLIAVLVALPYFGYKAIERSIIGGGTVPTNQVSSAPSSAPLPNPGDEGTLKLEDGGTIVLTTDLEAFRRLKTASRANDDYGRRELLNEGKILYATTGTRVKYLDGDPLDDYIHVRILDGKYKGREGWTVGKVFAR